MADGIVDIKYLLNSDEFARESARVESAIRGTEGVTGSAVNRMDGDFKRLARTVGQIGIVTALAAAGREVYRFSRDFESKMAEVVTLSDEIEANLDSYKDKIIDLTKVVPVMADQSAAALYQIVSAGHDGADGMMLLKQSAKAAVAGVSETATAADGITSILNAYGMSAAAAESASDMMFTTVRLGKTTFGELAGYISQVTPTAAAYGVEMDQVLAAIATLTKSGVPTAQAVTRIRQAIIAASKVLGDGAFEGRSLQEALALVAAKADGSESKLRALVPEVEAVSGVLGLTGINAQTAAEHLDEMTRSAGATEKAFQQQMRDPQKQIDLLKNNLLAAFSEIGDGALNLVGGVAQVLNEAFATGAADKLLAAVVTLTVAYGTYRTQLLLVAAAKRLLDNARYDEEARQLAGLLSKEQQRALGIMNLNRLTQEQAAAVRNKVAADVEALRVTAQLAATEKVAATEAYRAALRRSLAAKEQVDWRQTDLALAKMSGDAAKVEEAQQALAAAQQERHAAAIAKKAAADTYATARTKAATAATVANALQTRAAAAMDTAGARAKNLFTAATLRLTRAFQAMKAAFISNPIGAIITLVTTAATAMALFGDNSEEVAGGVSAMSDALARHQAEINRETAKIDELFAALKKAKAGTQEYADAKDAILRSYGSYLSGLGEEVRQLKDVEGAYVAIKDAAIESATARAKAAFVEDAESRAAGKMGKAISGLREGLESQLDDKLIKENPGLVDRLVAEMTKSMSRPGVSGAAAKYEIANLLRGYGLDKTDVADMSEHGFMWNKDYIEEYVEALQSLEQVRKTAEEVFNPKPGGGGGDGEKEKVEEVSERVAALRKQIKDTEEEIKKLTAPDSTATDVQITQAREKLKTLKAQLENYTGVSAKGAADAVKKQQELGQGLTQAEIDAQTQRVAAMKEGRMKRLAEIDLEHKQTLAKIDKDRATAKANGASSTQLGVFDSLSAAADAKRDYDRQQAEVQYARELMDLYRQVSDVFLSAEEKKERAIRRRYEEERRELKKRYDGGNLGYGLAGTANYLTLSYGLNRAENKEVSDLYLAGIKTMKEREAEIVARYDQIIAAAEATGEQEKIDQAKAKRDQELADLKTAQEDWYRVLFGELETYSTSAVLGAIQKARQYIDSYREQTQKSGRKLTPEEEAALAKIYKSTVSAEQAVRNKIPAGLKQTSQALREVAGLAAEFDKNLAGAIGSVAQIVEGFGDIQQGLGDFRKALAESKERKAEREKTGEKASFTDTIGSISAFAGAAGAVVGGVTKIIGVFKGWARQARLAEKEVRDFYMTAYIGAKSYEAMIRQRDYDWIDAGAGRVAVLLAQIEAVEAEIERLRKMSSGRSANNLKIDSLIKDLKNLRAELDGIGGSAATSWDAANAKLEALKKNIADAAKDNAELLDKLRGEQYVSGQHTKRTWYTLGIGKKVIKEFSSLAGKSAEEIEKLYSEGKLTEEAKKLYDAWKASGEELEKWAEELEQVDAALDEMATGTSFDSFLDDFASMLAEGRMGVEDFADFTEDTIKKAVLSSFKYKVLEAALRPWYDSLSDLFRQDGFPDKDEIQKWVSGLNAALPGIVEGLQDMLDELGIDLSDTAASGLRGEISEKITEETATKLEGLFRVTYDKVAEIRGLAGEQLQTVRAGFGDVAAILSQQYMIQENTRRTAENTAPLADWLAEVAEVLAEIKKGGGIYAK